MISFSDVLTDPEIRARLSLLKAHHRETYNHSVRVGNSMYELAKLLKTDPVTAARAGLMHDFGKHRVPVEILDKPVRLTPQEEAKMQMHTKYGGQELADFDAILAEIAYGHHEFQERPYMRSVPRISPGNHSDLIQLVALMDNRDSLLNPRVYRPETYEHDHAIQLVASQFRGDPYMLTTFRGVEMHLPAL